MMGASNVGIYNLKTFNMFIDFDISSGTFRLDTKCIT